MKSPNKVLNIWNPQDSGVFTTGKCTYDHTVLKRKPMVSAEENESKLRIFP